MAWNEIALTANVVEKSLFDAQTILAAVSDNTPVAVTVAEQTMVGRITAGNITALTPAQIRTLLNVEDNADVTDTANVTAAGAVMASTLTTKGDIFVATGASTVVRLAVGSDTDVLTANSAQTEGIEWAAAGAPGAHDLGGVSHNADTLADLNSKVSDATLDDSGDPRTPSSHAASHKNGGSDEILLHEFGEPTGAIAIDGQQLTNIVIHNVADAAARGGLTEVAGKVCYQVDTDVLYVSTGP